MAKNDSRFDPLARLIKIAAQYELEVHPWFNVMLRQRDFFPQYYDAGTPDECFDVHKLEFRDFICNLMIECISRYEFQGINLDYIRACAICDSHYCAEDYRRQSGGRNLKVDRLIYGRSLASRDAIVHWQEKAVEDIVHRISSYVRANHESMVISVCAHPGLPNLYIQGQNSVKWADSGLIDIIYAMHYEANPDWEAIKGLQQQMMRPESLVVLLGNYDWIGINKTVVPRAGAQVSNLIEAARSVGQNNGVGLYIYSMLNDDQVNSLSRGAFKVRTKPHSKKSDGNLPNNP
jgi:uncharacterized lipoprotein YddW (UPF0748 family)